MAGLLPWCRYLVDVSSRLAMDTHCVYRTPLPNYVDETTQLRILQWLLYVQLIPLILRARIPRMLIADASI